MRKLFASRTVFSASLTLLVVGSLLAMQACTAGEGATPTCVQDVSANGNADLDNGCNQFAACRADPLNTNSPILPATECCKSPPITGSPFQGTELKICLCAYGEDVEKNCPSPSENGAGGAGGGK